MSLVTRSMSLSCPSIGTFVIPGKSIKVKSGQVGENIVRIIGSSTMFLLFPQILSVSMLMLSRTFLKSVNFLSGISSKIA